jgi:hypothetical protein
MKKLLLSLAIAFGAINSGSAADLYVNNSGQSGTYTSINLALAAASSGDRIFVSPLNFYAEDLTITKSITIASTNSDSKIALSGNIALQPIPNMNVTLIGIECNSLGLSSVASSSTIQNPATINILSCSIASNVTFINSSGLRTYIHDSKITGFLYLKHLELTKSVITGKLLIDAEANQSATDSVKLIASYIGTFDYCSKDFFLFMANCYVYSSSYLRQIPSSQLSGRNTITNTIFKSSVYVMYYPTGTLDWTGLTISNSRVMLDDAYASPSAYSGSSYSDLAGRYISSGYYNSSSYPYYYQNSGTVNASKSPNVLYSYTNHISNFTPQELLTGISYGDLAGDFHYNKITSTLYASYPSSGGIDDPSWITIFDIPALVDAGSPSSNYTDLDLTRNDIGILGGSHSWLNYWYNDSTTTGKAVIRWVDLPSEIWPGQTINLKAEAVHTN